MPVAEPVELHPDDDADVLHHVLPVQLLPAIEPDEMVPRHQGVLKACHHSWSGDKLPHFNDMILKEDIRDIFDDNPDYLQCPEESYGQPLA